jgi:hypothetical protein
MPGIEQAVLASDFDACSQRGYGDNEGVRVRQAKARKFFWSVS